jgi:hypothetical protein
MTIDHATAGAAATLCPAPRCAGELAIYDPDQGLKEIVVWEAAEKHYRRAKDATNLYKAVEAKLTAQRDFVRWWDGLGEKSGSGPSKRRRSSTTPLPIAGQNGLPSRDVIERWRKRTAGDDRFERTLEDARLRCVRICEQQNAGTVRGTEGTGEFERYTRALYVEAARQVLGTIDLDPASSDIAQKTVKATQYFTVDDDGLSREWHGRVFLNPPYHRELAPKFIAKLVEELAAGHVSEAVMLTNNCTDTEWFDVALRESQSVCFTRGRIRFTTPNEEEVLPTQGQAFFYFGPNPERFEEVFCKLGNCPPPKKLIPTEVLTPPATGDTELEQLGARVEELEAEVAALRKQLDRKPDLEPHRKVMEEQYREMEAQSVADGESWSRYHFALHMLDDGQDEFLAILLDLLGLPADPWSGLMYADLKRWTAGRSRVAKQMGFRVDRRGTDEVDLATKVRAVIHREWLLGRQLEGRK